MQNGDRLFGPNGASGAVTGTAASITIPLDFSPQWVQLYNTTSGAVLFWCKEMPADSGYVFGGGGGGGGTTGNASGGTPSATFNALGTHSHNLSVVQNENISIAGPVGSLSVLAATVCSLYATVGGITGPLTIIPSAQTPATGQVAYNYATNLFSFFAGDAITAASATYVPLPTSSTSAGTPSATFNLLANHNHSYPGGGGGSFVSSGGVTSGSNGFSIGTDASINITGNNIAWNAGR